MKISKIVSAAAVALVMAATMVVSAAADETGSLTDTATTVTTGAVDYKAVVECAKANGVQDHNVKQLENFLEPNASYFTAKQYDRMIEVLNETGKIVDKYANGTDKSAMTNEERTKLFKMMDEADRQQIIKNLQDLGTEVGVVVTVNKRSDNDGYDVSATIDTSKTGDDTSGKSGEGDTSKGGKDGGKATYPTNTGDKAPNTGNTNSAAAGLVAGISIALAASGIIVVSKKNKDK